MTRDNTGITPRANESRLIVSWQHPDVRAMEPVGMLSFDGATYRFEYLERARTLGGFQPLLGFPEIGRLYDSDELFPLFAQRAMDPRRSDFERYVRDLALDAQSTPWEQIARSGGGREGDTVQLFAIPAARILARAGGELHRFLYGDPKRVGAARVQAEGRIARRQLWHLLVESWAVPVVEWLSRRLPK